MRYRRYHILYRRKKNNHQYSKIISNQKSPYPKKVDLRTFAPIFVYCQEYRSGFCWLWYCGIYIWWLHDSTQSNTRANFVWPISSPANEDSQIYLITRSKFLLKWSSTRIYVQADYQNPTWTDSQNKATQKNLAIYHRKKQSVYTFWICFFLILYSYDPIFCICFFSFYSFNTLEKNDRIFSYFFSPRQYFWKLCKCIGIAMENQKIWYFYRKEPVPKMWAYPVMIWTYTTSLVYRTAW